MNTKWSVIGLIAVGLVAAMCVAILVALLPGRGERRAEPQEVQLVQAVGPLEKGTVITREHITVRKEIGRAHV